MSITATIFARLNTSSITDLVTANRIYPTDPTENTNWPFLVYTIRDEDTVTTMSGGTLLTRYSVQIDIWAKTLEQRTQLADAIRTRLSAYRGTPIQASLYRSEQPERIGNGNEGDVYHSALNFTIWAVTS